MKPTIGRVVHFVQQDPLMARAGEVQMKILPAIIVAVWSDTCVNLQVFTDGSNSERCEHEGVKWITSASLDESESPQQRTWHWPPKV